MFNGERSPRAILLAASVLASVSALLFLVGPARLRPAYAAEGDAIKDRIEIQEKLLYAYAYAYDSKDCVGWSNLFTTDAVLALGGTMNRNGRDAIRQGCVERQRDVVGNIMTHHNMTNIVFDKLTSRRAETRTYCILTWQKPGNRMITVQNAFVYKDVIVKSDNGKWLFQERKGIY